MCGGNKTTTSQKSTYTPTAQATGLYNNVIGQATTAANTPYNPATQQQVQGFTPDQLAAFGAVGDAQGAWTPYTDRAQELFNQSAGPISAEAIQGYMNPYQQQVIDAALAQSGRTDAIAQSALKGNALAAGALGGNSTGVAQAQLAGEQGRNRNSMLANLLSGGYSQALAAAQGDAARQGALGAQFGQLGQQVQGMTMNDIMAQLSVGNQQQQLGQQQLDANSANAAAQTMWPYQNAQWLASIAAGIGPLTGGTTTGSGSSKQGKGIGNVIGAGLSVASALSDRRAKEDAKVIGQTFDGQKVYSFRYKGSPKTQIGLMADEVERKHPEAVSTGPYGLKMVDYDQATENRGFANGGAVQGNSPFGGAGASYFPWAPIVASQPMMPQLAQESGGGQQQADPMADPAQAIKLGKSARTGIEGILRSLDPAKGWGASIEGLNSAGGGGGLSSIMGSLGGMFGFRDGGAVAPSPYAEPRFVDGEASLTEGQIPVDAGRAEALARMFFDDRAVYGDDDIAAIDHLRMSGGYANGGGVNLAFLSPDLMSPYETRPNRTPPLVDEFIGEIGPSGIDEPSPALEPGQLNPDVLNERFPRSTGPAQAMNDGDNVPAAGLSPEQVASNERQMRSFEEAERAAGIGVSPWSIDKGTVLYKGRSLADRLAGRDKELSALDRAAREPIDEQAMPLSPYASESPSSWSFDGGTIRRNGRSFADWLAGREDTRALEAQANQPIDAQAMPTTPFAPTASGWGAETANAPYSDVFPDMPGAIGDASAVNAPGGETVPSNMRGAGTPFEGQPTATQPADGSQFDTLGFIKQQEGYQSSAKWDKRQWSNGYGTRARQGERIDRDEAERRLRRETSEVERWLDENVGVNLTPHQRGGLVSFGFNLGTGALDRLKDDINAGDFGRVAGRMKTFNKALNEETGKLEPMEGLTSRRTREAALVSGGAQLPAVGELPEETREAVTRATNPDAPVVGEYASKEDKQTGGLLKRVFGIDFNPLKLTENERLAVLTAGLHMMSTGDVGAGGLAGMKFLQGRETADRESAMAALKLGADLFKTQSDIDISRQRLELDKAGKPTDDARNYSLAKEEGFTGTFMDFMREKKLLDKGGAEIPAEVAARIGLGRAFMKDVPSLRKEISAFTATDRADLVLNRGKAADVWRRIESGREALVRQLTGAGMSQSEAENQTKRYQLSSTDKNETMLRKLEMLERDLKAVEEGAISGKTGTMSRQYQSGSPAPTSGARPRARNPQTGQVVEYDGSRWLEVAQ